MKNSTNEASQSLEVHQHWLKSILHNSTKELSEWEDNFVSSIEERLGRGTTLTAKQEEILERIYAEKTA